MLFRPPREFRRALCLAFVLTVSYCAFGLAADVSPAHSAPSGWTWPVNRGRQVSRAFVAPATEFGAGHRGIDVPATVGEILVAPTDVRVAFSGRVVDRDVITLDAGEWAVGGSHLTATWLVTFDGASATVDVGSRVPAGAPVAVVSPTPHCACVHVGLRYAGEYVNPLLVWGEVPRAVLLPW